MTNQAISPLRRRMIEDMAIRKFAPKTQHDYVQRVKDFAAFLGRSPDLAKSEDVRGFRLHLASSGAGAPKINATVSALRFFFNVTLDRPELAKHLAFMHEPRKVPVVLSAEEVARFLEAAPSVKYKAALSVAYGAGLRVSEVVSLQRRQLQVEGLQDRGTQPLQGDDAHDPRVHSQIPHSRAPQRLPPHPPLRPVRQQQARREHRPGARTAQRAHSAKPGH
jgi:site-specific recombinase XerD